CENVQRTGQAPAPAPAPAPTPAPGTPQAPQTPATPPAPGSPGATAHASVGLARTTRLGAALRSGLPVKLAGLKPGRVQVRALRGTKVAASAFATVGASGKASVVLRFSKTARAQLAHVRSVRLVLAAGSVRSSVTLKR